ncbi:MAG: phosphate ABC transporter substrate-binding protein [Anaerolineaceae bacterium]|jgi:phosphate transport system substrate-binding protein
MRKFLVVIVLLTATVLSACGGTSASGSLSLAGSTTVQPLAEKLAESFMSTNPDVQIDVQGGGSSVGVKAAGEGTSDIGMASREIKQEELTQFPNLQVHVIARDGIAVVVHPDNPVSDLSLDQIRDIFSGKIVNWSEVGGADAAITVAAREEGSGTRDAFMEMVMGKDALIVDSAILQSSNGAIRTVVSTTPNVIAFLSFGYLDESTKAVSIGGAAATEENAASGVYPVVRPLNLLTNGAPEGLVKAFLDFVLSPEGQKMVREEGYIPVK